MLIAADDTQPLRVMGSNLAPSLASVECSPDHSLDLTSNRWFCQAESLVHG